MARGLCRGRVSRAEVRGGSPGTWETRPVSPGRDGLAARSQETLRNLSKKTSHFEEMAEQYKGGKIALMNSFKNAKGFTLWFTGLSGAGKSTNAYNVYEDKP